MNDKYKCFVTVNFNKQHKPYYFGLNDQSIGYGDYIVVETTRGLELVEVVSNPDTLDKLPGNFELKPVIRKANQKDLKNYEESLELSKVAMEAVQRFIEELGLKMNPISAEYTLDHRKVLIVYVADERVDFRELLRRLNAELRARIELRQIGERDKAKMISGIATCGMETCCSRFMRDFDMISINMAKNQNLALNISKLSGLCGKFMCCLKHEDEMYTEMKSEWPAANSKVMYKGNEYYVNSLNYIGQEAKLMNKEETIYVPFEEAFKDHLRAQRRKEQE
ncbi:MAG: stage 0 sporulation protein [Erysipelothrix sp.]|nr:stage 0 sporulation protein [Erysipelothrix sp.]